jgi:hypothetical protein
MAPCELSFEPLSGPLQHSPQVSHDVQVLLPSNLIQSPEAIYKEYFIGRSEFSQIEVRQLCIGPEAQQEIRHSRYLR